MPTLRPFFFFSLILALLGLGLPLQAAEPRSLGGESYVVTPIPLKERFVAQPNGPAPAPYGQQGQQQAPYQPNYWSGQPKSFDGGGYGEWRGDPHRYLPPLHNEVPWGSGGRKRCDDGQYLSPYSNGLCSDGKAPPEGGCRRNGHFPVNGFCQDGLAPTELNPYGYGQQQNDGHYPY